MGEAPGSGPQETPQSSMTWLAAAFPTIDDHPDVAGVLRDAELLARLGPLLADPFRDAGVTKVLAPEARGPVLGALVAVDLGVGLVLARKRARNHPGADLAVTAEPSWRGTREEFQARSFDLREDDRVLVVDDWITTGSSARAARQLLSLAGATYVGASVLVNKAPPEVIEELGVRWAVRFEHIGHLHH